MNYKLHGDSHKNQMSKYSDNNKSNQRGKQWRGRWKSDQITWCGWGTQREWNGLIDSTTHKVTVHCNFNGEKTKCKQNIYEYQMEREERVKPHPM